MQILFREKTDGEGDDNEIADIHHHLGGHPKVGHSTHLSEIAKYFNSDFIFSKTNMSVGAK